MTLDTDSAVTLSARKTDDVIFACAEMTSVGVLEGAGLHPNWHCLNRSGH